MEEAQLLCDRVGIIDHGKIVAEGRPADMIRQIGEDVAYILIDDMSRAGEFQALDCVKKVAVGDKISLVLDDGPSTVPKIFDYAAKKNIRILSIELRTPTLNDVFLHYVGRELRPEHSDGKGPIHLRKRFAG